jgi:hypothetical protein
MQEAKGQRILIWAVAVFILAFLLRFLHIAAIYKNSPFFEIFPGDLGGYDRWATSIVEYGWLGKDIFYQDPLYPYFLAFFYKLIGRDFFWIYTVQALLGACISPCCLSCWVIRFSAGQPESLRDYYMDCMDLQFILTGCFSRLLSQPFLLPWQFTCFSAKN